jgi:uncharacterized membrane protein YhaH (DUF805 family)
MNVLGMYVALLVVGFIAGMVSYPHDPSDGFYVIVQLASVGWLWYIGLQRMRDTGYSEWWAIFTPFIIGMIVIGCLASKENSNDL